MRCTVSIRGVTVKYFALLIILGLGALSADLAAADVTLEAEALRNAHNIGNGDITIAPCAAASGHYAIDGLDYQGEWIELSLLILEEQCFYVAVRSAGLLGVIRDFAVEFIPEAPATSSGTDSLTTIPGGGIT
jgi:hypothetical protein